MKQIKEEKKGIKMKLIYKIVVLGAIMLSMACASTKGKETVTADISQSYLYQASMAQVHRWFQVYENDKTSIENQLDILSDDIFVKSRLGEARGQAEYLERLKMIPKIWQNAHIVKDVSFSVQDDGRISLNFGVDYTNTGMQDYLRTADLHYSTVLQPTETLLPKFEKIEIAQKSTSRGEDGQEFVSAYPQNRLLSLLHYWLAIIEAPDRKPEPAKEIFAEKFLLNFSSGPITTYEGFKSWLAGPASSVKYSSHKIKNFRYEEIEASKYKMVFDFDWAGVLPNGDKMTAETKHTWLVSDNPQERFARMQQVDVEVLQPFRVVK